MSLLQLLAKLFGKSYLSKIMGTRTNIAKPIRMDKNSPFKKYSDGAFVDQKDLDYIEAKINEYGPYALSNKNPQELANFEANAQRLLAAKNKQTGTTEGMIAMSDMSDLMKMTDDDLNALAKEGDKLKSELSLVDQEGSSTLPYQEFQEKSLRLDKINNILEKAQKLPNTGKGLAEDIKAAGGKPEADIIDIATQQKVDDTGIMKLKKDLGLPEDVPADSALGELLLQQGRNRVNYLNKKKSTESAAKPFSIEIEGQVRTASREFLNRELKLGKIKLKPEETKSILQPSGSGTDPIDILRTYYGEDVLEALDDLAPKFMQAEKYSDYLKIIDNNLDESFFTPRKDPSIKQSYTDDEMKDIVNKQEDDLGDKLKNLPDDIDPDALANGGRPGFKSGGLSLLNLFGKQRTNAAKQIKRSIDNIFTTDDAKYDADVVVDEIMEYLNIDRDAVDQNDISDLYGKAYSALTKQRFDAKKLMDSVNQKGKGAVTTADNIAQPTKTLKSIKDTGTIDISNDDIMGEFEAFIRRTDPEGMKPIDALVEKMNLKGKKRTDNAEGGRIGFSAGSIKVTVKEGLTGFKKFRDLIRNLAKERGMQGSNILKMMNYKNLNPDIKSKLSKAEFDKFKLEVQESKRKQLENFREMFQSRVNFNKSIEQGQALDDGGTGMSDIFKYLDEDFSKNSPVPRDINEEDVLMLDQLIKNQTVNDDPRKLKAQGGLNYLMGL